MKIKYTFFSLLIFLLIQNLAYARAWQKITIPNLSCGNGEPYSIFYERNSSTQLVVEFMGGGACWSEATCHGEDALTNLSPLSGVPRPSVFTEEKDNNPWKDHSILYMPYCTGDVFAGNHFAQYKEGLTVQHAGAINTQKTFEHLHRESILDFHRFTDVTVGGSSAGGVAVLLHAQTLDFYLNPFASKYAISDSPGLHFGSTFWQKFSNPMKKDFEDSFLKVSLKINFSDGLLAPLMGPVFIHYSGWKIAILQSTKDIVMSIVFGEITPAEHRKLVLGSRGIGNISKNFKNMRTWIADVSTHTFLSNPGSSSQRGMTGETAKDFVYQFYTE